MTIDQMIDENNRSYNEKVNLHNILRDQREIIAS